MQDEKIPINRFIGNISSCIYKILCLSMNYVYKACNPTFLKLSTVKKI